MDIKPITREKRELDIREWNESVKAFIKPMNGFDRLAFNDFFLAFYRKSNDPETRFDAGFRAALLVLVDENDQPLFTEADRDAVRAGSFLPLFRLFDEVIAADRDEVLQTTKKN